MNEENLDEIKDKRNNLAKQIETLIQNFTNKTNYIVEKISIDYKNTDAGLIPKDPAVRISIRLGGMDNQAMKLENSENL